MFRHCPPYSWPEISCRLFSRSRVGQKNLWRSQSPFQTSRTQLKCIQSLTEEKASRFLRALTWEEDRGFQNAQGLHEMFSSFASRAISDLEIPYELDYEKRVLSSGLTHYDSLDVPDRKILIQTCRKLINELQSSLTNPSQSSFDSGQNEIKRWLDAETIARIADKSYITDDSSEEDGNGMIQGTQKWSAFRQKRLTASTFSRVLGMFTANPATDTHNLWLEKLGLKESFQGNEMTQWGSKMEYYAREEYRKLTEYSIDCPGIGVLGKHISENWLAGSPDGLVGINGASPSRNLSTEARQVLVPDSGQGVLEIKCPFGGRRGPNYAKPPDQMAAYYMPQVQGLMNIFDRDWCHLYYWTKFHGTKVFLVYRDVHYWELLYEVLAKFWWEHVMPAKICLERKDDGYQKYKPCLETLHLIEESTKLARKAPQIHFEYTSQVM